MTLSGRVKFSKRIASVVRAERSFLKPAEKAIGFLIRIPDLRVFGSRQISPATPELFFATQRRYAERASPSCASDVSQSF
jgi:hypothetical protein